MEGDWKINSYKNKFEPDEQWKMRKKFMEANKHKFAEDRVVCLAQVLVNMEFLGTRYPIETMRTVNELSQDIIGEFKERQKTRLQRTVVGGTDAACAKVKGTRLPSTSKSEIDQKTTETNVEYFTSAIVSSSSKSFVKEEMQSKLEPNSKLNPSSAVSNKVESDTKSPSRKRKKKKKACNIEETPTNNVASRECVSWNSSQGSVQLEKAVEPILKKKKLKNKNAEIVCPKIPTISNEDDSEIKLPSNKRKKEKIACSMEEIPTNNVTSSEFVTRNSSEAHHELEEIVEPICKKKKLISKNGIILNNHDETACPEIPNFVIIIPGKVWEKIKQSTSSDSALNRMYRLTIVKSARLSAVLLKVKNNFLEDQGKWESVLLLDGRKITSSLDLNRQLSEKNVFKLAFPILLRKHYQIVITDKTCVSAELFMSQVEDARLSRDNITLNATISKDAMAGKANKTLESLTDNAFEILSTEDNSAAQPVNSTAAMKMMKMMGWTEGTGLGLQKQGIVEPINADVLVGRKGIGSLRVNARSFVPSIRRYLENYENSALLHSIVFSNEFTSEERKLIHDVAHEMGMVSSSVGDASNRKLTVRRSPPFLIELVNRLIESKGSDPLFSRINLIPPTG